MKGQLELELPTFLVHSLPPGREDIVIRLDLICLNTNLCGHMSVTF